MTRITVDASVAFDWMMDDEDDPRSAEALTLVSSSGAIVPALWHWEIRNALEMAIRRGRVPETDAQHRLQTILSMDIETDPSPDWPLTISLARNHRLTVYDASYLALAVSRGSKLASLDRELVRAARNEGVTLLA